MIAASFRPIERWPGKPRGYRKPSRFRVLFGAILDDLEKELEYLGARDIIIQIAVDLKDIRNDGWPKSNVRPRHPGVILNFVAGKIPYQFACDTYDDWQDNLRAIGLTLAALRAVDRYGATQYREQYRGFAQLPPGEVDPPQVAEELHDPVDEAAAVLASYSGLTAAAIAGDLEVARIAWRRAAERTHPDKGGNGAEFLHAQRAWELLQQHHGVRA